MNRTTNQIFKFIHKHPVGLNKRILETQFANKTALDESILLLIQNNLIAYRNGFIELTVTGYDYYYNRNKERLFKILKLFISPIIVGIVTSIVTAKLVSSSNNCNCNVTCDYPNNDLK